MKVEINPTSLLNLKEICELLYKLHPIVLDDLVEINYEYDDKPLTPEQNEYTSKAIANAEVVTFNIEEDNEDMHSFFNLKRYLKLNTNEYIPIKFCVEIEDPFIVRKVKKMLKNFEKTEYPEKYLDCKEEMDEFAYFAEGYGLKMNEEQKKKHDDFYKACDVDGLIELLEKENLYP